MELNTTPVEPFPKLDLQLKQPDSEWVERCNIKGWTRDHDYPDEKLNKLKHLLLDIAGFSVCLYPEEDINQLLSVRAELLDGRKALQSPGLPNQCHFNSAQLWAESEGRLMLYTGYALTEDGMWRQHSWCVVDDGSLQVVETTIPRLAYFGFRFSDIEASEFYEQNF